jgi:hypothetical protein
MLRIMVLLLVMSSALVGCDDKSQSPASTASPTVDHSREREDAAMRKFLNREGARVRTVEEIRAAERAKNHDQ